MFYSLMSVMLYGQGLAVSGDKPVVDCRVALSGKAGGKISVDELRKLKGPDLLFLKTEDKEKAFIKSFRISFLLGDNSAFVEEISGNKFSNRSTDIIKKMKRGDKLFIENIKVGYEDGRVQPFNSMTFVVE